MAIKTYSLKKDGSKKVSTNFTAAEFHDAYTDEFKIDDKLIEYIQKIRDHFKKPVIITSGYRDVNYNSQVGGAWNSLHTQGKACDFYISGVDVLTIAKYAESIGILGIGCYQDDRFVHIDTRTNKFYWYNQSNTETLTFGGNVANYPTKRRGDSGDYIPTLQTKLNLAGIKGADGKALTVDGEFGANTDYAVRAFQKKYSLVVDGIVGPATWAVLARIS